MYKINRDKTVLEALLFAAWCLVFYFIVHAVNDVQVVFSTNNALHSAFVSKAFPKYVTSMPIAVKIWIQSHVTLACLLYLLASTAFIFVSSQYHKTFLDMSYFEDTWEFIDTVLYPGLYPVQWYNGAAFNGATTCLRPRRLSCLVVSLWLSRLLPHLSSHVLC